MWISKKRYEELVKTEQDYLRDAKVMNYWIEHGRKMKEGVEHTINSVFCGRILTPENEKNYNDLMIGFEKAGAFGGD